MTTRTVTTYEHSCDLCGQLKDKAELRHLCIGQSHSLRDEPRDISVKATADICGACQAKPISDAIAALDADAERRRQPMRVQIVRPA